MMPCMKCFPQLWWAAKEDGRHCGKRRGTATLQSETFRWICWCPAPFHWNLDKSFTYHITSACHWAIEESKRTRSLLHSAVEKSAARDPWTRRRTQIKFRIFAWHVTSFLFHSLEHLKSLKDLNLCRIAAPNVTLLLFSTIVRLEDLTDLNLNYSSLKNLPENIGDLAHLNKLNIGGSYITSLPTSIRRLKNLTHLDISITRQLLSLPNKICDLVSLKKLNLQSSYIILLPS